MTHKQIYIRYKDLMPLFADKTTTWFPSGKNTIRVRLNTKEEFIFSYDDDRNWFLETVDIFIARTKKGVKRCNA